MGVRGVELTFGSEEALEFGVKGFRILINEVEGIGFRWLRKLKNHRHRTPADTLSPKAP